MGLSTFPLAVAILNNSLKSMNSNLCIGIIKSSSANFSTVVEFEKLMITLELVGLKVP